MGIMDLFKKKTSGNVAKDRLKLVLVSDRANCSDTSTDNYIHYQKQDNIHPCEIKHTV